jgi:hypothetical protein
MAHSSLFFLLAAIFYGNIGTRMRCDESTGIPLDPSRRGGFGSFVMESTELALTDSAVPLDLNFQN